MGLFSKEMEIQTKLPNRPLLGLSDFACDVFPLLLDGVKKKKIDAEFLVEVVEVLVEASDKDLKNLSDDDLLVARVDLLFLQMGILHAQKGEDGKPPEIIATSPSLDKKVELVSELTGRPQCLTYEDLIFLNPINDRRTLTKGQVGWSEFCFYEIHRLIELKFDEVVSALERVHENLLKGDNSQAVAALAYAREVYKTTFKELGMVTRQMDPALFTAFRFYFDEHPVNKLKGPSGQFSINVPTIEILLSYEKIPNDIVSYWMDNKQYFPKNGWQRFTSFIELVKSKGSILSLSGEDKDLLEQIGLFDRDIRTFRVKHLSGAKYQLPENVFKAEANGTSGEQNVPAFLRDRINIQHI